MKSTIKVLKGKFTENSYLKNVVVLMFGSGISQLIPFAISVVLSRLYTSEEFGVFTLFSSIVSFLAVISTMRYEVAIMLPKRNIEAFHLVVLSLIISLFVSVTVLISTLLFPISISELLSSQNIKPWLFLLGISVFLVGGVQTFTIWFNRRKKYKIISSTMVSQSATTATINTINGFSGLTSGGLIIGGISGQFIAFVNYARLFFKYYSRLFKYFSWQRLWKAAKDYSDYPKFSFPHRLVDMISITGLPIIIAFLFTEAILGWYGFMLRVLKAPLGILAASLGQVYFQQLSEQVAQRKSVKSLFRKTVLRIAVIILPFFIVILIWGPDIFAFVFSEKWRQAGVYAQYLTPWLLVSSITSPVSQTPLSLGYVKLNMIAGIIGNLLIVTIFIVFAKVFDNIESVFLIIGIVMPVFYLLLLLWYNAIINKYERDTKLKS